MILFTTFIVNAYIVLLSFQVNGIMDSNAIRTPMLIFLVAECLLVLFLYSGLRHERRKMRLPGIIICAIAFLVFVLGHLAIVRITVSHLVELTFFPICLIVTYVNFISIREEKTFDQIIDLQFLYLLIVAAIFLFAQVLKRGEYTKNVNTVYYVIFALPFILQNKNNYKKWIGVGVIFICLFLSLKRAPLLAVVAALIFYFNSKQTLKTVLNRAFWVVFAVVAVDVVFSVFLDIHLLDRMLSLSEDGGSGRVDLIKQTMDLLKVSSTKELILGHNLKATFTVMRYGAHNDFLEVLYRMGFVGFFIYLGFFIGLISAVKKFSETGDFQNANFLKATAIMFAIVSFSSQLLFLPTYIGLIAMAISFGISHNNFKSNQSETLSEGGM